VGLLPKRDGKGLFTGLLESLRQAPEQFVPLVGELWKAMDSGEFSVAVRAQLPRFNGKLFKAPQVLPLNRAQIDLLLEAARADWSEVEPAIFGTLLERALDPAERHSLGAHYTPRAYVERLVLPTVIDPLRGAWRDIQAAALLLAGEGKLNDAAGLVRDYHHRLCRIRVLDPACGSGNFLYVTLEHLKRLEGEVLDTLAQLGDTQGRLEAEGLSVDPHQFLGLEINPRAAAIAEMVLWIGYLQWHFRTRGAGLPPSPILRDFRNIECRDAVLAHDGFDYVLDERGVPITRWDGRTAKPHPVTGEAVPDETARLPVERYRNPRKATWPDADFIIGNPPFIGASAMRQALGDGYVEALRGAWPDVPESADFVMFWWHQAAEQVRHGRTRRFGFITTNSIRQTFNRRVLELHISPERHSGASPLLSGTFSCEQLGLNKLEFTVLMTSLSIREELGGGALEERRPYLGQEFPQTALEGGCLAVQRQQQVGDQRRQDLDAYRVLAATQEGFDLQMLLDPLEEQLDPPACLVALGNHQRRARQIVGRQHQRRRVVGSRHCHAAQGLGVGVRVTAPGMAMTERHFLIGQDRSLGFRRQVAHALHPQRRVLLEAGDEAGARCADVVPPGVVAIAFVEDVDRLGFERQPHAFVPVVDVGGREAVAAGNLGPRVIQQVQLDALRVARACCARPGIEPRAFEGETGGVEQVEQLAGVSTQRTLRLRHELAGRVGKDLRVALAIGVGQRGTPDGAGAKVVVMVALAVVARFQYAQAGSTTQVAVDHRHEVTPAAKPFAVFVGSMPFHQSVKRGARQGFHDLVQSAYPEHVAGSVVELALRVLSRTTLPCNASQLPLAFYSGQQWAQAGIQAHKTGPRLPPG
jgi:hypothetical protein